MAYLGPPPSQKLATPTSQYFSGNGSTTAFTLNRPVNVAEDLNVFVNNVAQQPGSGKSYTATGTTLTFDAAPDAGTNNVYVVYRGLAEPTTRLEHPSGQPLAATTGTFSSTLGVAGAASVGNSGTVSASRSLTVVGATDGSGSSIIVGYNNSLAAKFAVRDDGFITTTGNIGIASGQGIDFSATGNGSGTPTSELFDDYEEGSWTAALTGSTSGPTSAVNVTGTYVKVGRLVTVRAHIGPVSTVGAAGGVRVSGLPYTPAANMAAGNVMMYHRKNLNSTTCNITPYVTTGTIVTFYQTDYQNTASWAEVGHNQGSDFYLFFSAAYETNS